MNEANNKQILVLSATALLLVGIVCLLLYLYRQIAIPTAPPPTPTITPGAAELSEVSDSSDLETIGKEIEETEIGSFDEDIADLDSQAEQL